MFSRTRSMIQLKIHFMFAWRWLERSGHTQECFPFNVLIWKVSASGSLDACIRHWQSSAAHRAVTRDRSDLINVSSNFEAMAEATNASRKQRASGNSWPTVKVSLSLPLTNSDNAGLVWLSTEAWEIPSPTLHYNENLSATYLHDSARRTQRSQFL